MDETPTYEHDRECCRFLGTWHVPPGTMVPYTTGPKPFVGGPYDLYWCDAQGYPTVLARYSDEPSEYTSGLAGASLHPALGEARRRAVALGLRVGAMLSADDVKAGMCRTCGLWPAEGHGPECRSQLPRGGFF